MNKNNTLYFPIITSFDIDQAMIEDFHQLLSAGMTATYEGEISDNYIYSILPEDLGEIYDYFIDNKDYYLENGFEGFEKELEFINKLVKSNKISRIIIKLTNDDTEVYSITR